MPFGTEKLEWFDYLMVKKYMIQDMFIRFDRMHERDRPTNTHRMTAMLASHCAAITATNKYS